MSNGMQLSKVQVQRYETFCVIFDQYLAYIHVIYPLKQDMLIMLDYLFNKYI